MRERELFVHACELDDRPAREDYLRRECSNDPELRKRVEGLIATRETIDNFMVLPDIGLPVNEMPDRVGDKIGPYFLREVIGEGGFGVVYVADQHEPISRVVAIKLIKPGMDSREIVGRFEAERQALALMNHPNIAKVLEGGTTADGRPYFVMELVDGIPITDFVAQHETSLISKLHLMRAVCEAVEHAHKKGIIHRDLKPSNVLVTLQEGEPVPKVIDFGIAKALEQRVPEQTIRTAVGQLVGTPMYMSPEQAELGAQDVDTRTDVYSLGILLYELLTGLPPFDRQRFKAAGLEAMLKMIRESEPLRPSLRTSEAATDKNLQQEANRNQSSTRRQSAELKGELDWIVMKAIEKDRNRRYESANAFAADIGRFLAFQPVDARPASSWYRFRKFVRRQRLPLSVAILCTLLVCLLAGSIVWAWLDQIDRRIRVEQQANLMIDQAQRLANQEDWSEALAVVEDASSLVEESQATPKVAHRIDQLVDEFQLIVNLEQARLATATWVDDGFDYDFDYRSAERSYRTAFENSGIDVDTSDSNELVDLIEKRFVRQATIIEALDHWAIIRTTLQTTSTNIDRVAASSVQTNNAGRSPDELSRRLWRIASQLDPEPLRIQLRSWLQSIPEDLDKQAIANLANRSEVQESKLSTQLVVSLLMQCDMSDRAIAALRRVHARHPDDFFANFDLATAIYKGGMQIRTEAIQYYLAALALRPNNAVVLDNLALCMFNRGQIESAEAFARKAIQSEPQNAIAWNVLGEVLRCQNRLDKAAECYQKAISLNPKFPPPYLNLSLIAVARGIPDAALEFAQEARRVAPDQALVHSALGAIFLNRGMLEQARDAVATAIELDPRQANAHHALGKIHYRSGRMNEAVEEFQLAIQLSPHESFLYVSLGLCLRYGMTDGIDHDSEALNVFQTALQVNASDFAAHDQLARLLTNAKNPAFRNPNLAVHHAKRALELCPESQRKYSMVTLGMAYYVVQEWSQSLETLGQAQQLNGEPNAPVNLFLALCHEKLGSHEQALEYYRKASWQGSERWFGHVIDEARACFSPEAQGSAETERVKNK